jgi:hypothetical protein
MRHEDDEPARAVDALDPVELDVGRRRRAGDERDRPALAGDALDRLGDELDDLRRLDDADVEVGDERQRAPALLRRGGEDDRAGLGDRDRAAGDDAVERVELPRPEAVVDDRAVRSPGAPESVRDGDPAAGAGRGDGAGDVCDDPDFGAVLADALAEEFDERVAVARPGAAVLARDARRDGRRRSRRERGRGSPRGRSPRPPPVAEAPPREWPQIAALCPPGERPGRPADAAAADKG